MNAFEQMLVYLWALNLIVTDDYLNHFYSTKT